MNHFKRVFFMSLIFVGILLAAGCEEAAETAEKVSKDVDDALQAEATKDNEYLLSVQNGSLTDYPDVTLKDAFGQFFSSPKWKYFQADTGEHVVEFTGYCTYMEKKVKATMQFVVEEGNEQFEIGALDFNEVPQNELVKSALLQKIYEVDNESTGETE